MKTEVIEIEDDDTIIIEHNKDKIENNFEMIKCYDTATSLFSELFYRKNVFIIPNLDEWKLTIIRRKK